MLEDYEFTFEQLIRKKVEHKTHRKEFAKTNAG